MKKIFLLLILLSSTQVFAEKIDDCEDFYEIAKGSSQETENIAR